MEQLLPLLNASRKIDASTKDMRGKLFVTAGLGGMSGLNQKQE